MNILITGASSEIATKISKKITNYKLYGISRVKINNLYEKSWILKDYTSLDIGKIFK